MLRKTHLAIGADMGGGLQATAPEPLEISVLPPELLGKAFGHLDDEERCHTIPLVCRLWLQAHKDYPPHRKNWRFPVVVDPCNLSYGVCGVSQGMAFWVSVIARNLMELEVTKTDPDSACFLPQMLAQTALAASKLQRLKVKVGCGIQPILQSLAQFSQIEKFTLNKWCFSKGPEFGSGIASLSGLLSLKELETEVDPLNGTPADANLLWKTLGGLQNLRILTLSASGTDDTHHGAAAYFFESMPLLTNISALELREHPNCICGIERSLPAGLSRLTQLTSLEVCHLWEGFPVSFLGLPKLESLRLGGFWDEVGPANIHIAAPKLSYLEFNAGGNPLETFLVIEPPALLQLDLLVIMDSDISTFPMSLAVKLAHLVWLDLSGNSFTRLPPSLVHMPALENLELNYYEDLQLEEGDEAIMASLTRLDRLYINKRSKGWSDTSVATLMNIVRMLPELLVDADLWNFNR